MYEDRKLTPAMRSRKLQALDFIKRYFAQWGASPSLEEIGGELGISRQRAQKLVQQLSREKQISQVAGKRRGISLPDVREQISLADALLVLAREGVIVNPPPLSSLLTKRGLNGLPELDHDED